MADTVRDYVVPVSDIPYVEVVRWHQLDGDDSGKPYKMAGFSDKTVHIYGDFGGSTVTIQGSNDERADPDHSDHVNADWQDLVDPQGNAISMTDAGIEVLLENPLWIRPLSASGSAASVSVAIVGRKAS